MTALPPLNGLRAFEVSGRRLSFRAAADELGVTQGAVAQQVRQLEAYLGLVLFDRVPKGLVLTAAGRSYHDRIEQAFADIKGATAELKPEQGRVLISVTPSFAAKWLIPNLPQFSVRHPDIDLRILATEKVSSFHADGIDLAVRQGTPPFGAALDAWLLFKQELIAVAAPSLIKAENLPLPPERLLDLPLIRDGHDLWPQFLANIGLRAESQRGLRLNQTALALDAAIAGQGVALASKFMVANEIESGKLLNLGFAATSAKQDFYLLAPRRTSRDEAVTKVIDWLR